MCTIYTIIQKFPEESSLLSFMVIIYVYILENDGGYRATPLPMHSKARTTLKRRERAHARTVPEWARAGGPIGARRLLTSENQLT